MDDFAEEAITASSSSSTHDKAFYMRQRTFGYLIADYLRTHSLNYSYSVFLPELHINSNNILLRDEICEAFSLKRSDIKQITELKSQLGEPVSALEILIDTLKKIKVTTRISREVQTENFDKSKNLQMKLDDINSEYTEKLDYFKLVNSKNIEDSMVKFKRECEARCKAEIEE